MDEIKTEKGYKNVTLNEDGSVTFVMTEKQHNEMMDDMKNSIEESYQGIIDNEFSSVISIEHNKDFTEFKLTLDANEVGIFESFSVLTLYISGEMYGIFNGTPDKNICVKFLDKDGNLLEESNSNDVMK